MEKGDVEIEVKRGRHLPDYFSPESYGAVINIEPNTKSEKHLTDALRDRYDTISGNGIHLIPRQIRGITYLFTDMTVNLENQTKTGALKDETTGIDNIAFTLLSLKYLLLTCGIPPRETQRIFNECGINLPLFLIEDRMH